MISRERVFKALSHEEPDRVPYNARLCIELQNAMQNEMLEGIDYRKYYKEDILFADIRFPEYLKRSLSYLPLPEKEDIVRTTETIRKMKQEGLAICNTYTPGVYEHIKEFLGDENALVDMYDSPVELKDRIDNVTEWLCKLNEIKVSMGIDICWIGDDIGAQKSLIMSLNHYREFYKPCHRELVNRIKKVNPAVKVAFHCCGHVTPLIPDLIDVGVDILETVQPEANNDLKFIKKEFGRDIVFWGAIGMQSVFYNRPSSEVVEEVRSSLRIMSKGGGYIAAPCHTVTPEMSLENVKAFYHALNNYGGYPNPG